MCLLGAQGSWAPGFLSACWALLGWQQDFVEHHPPMLPAPVQLTPCLSACARATSSLPGDTQDAPDLL